MKAGLPFVAPHALSRETRVAAEASGAVDPLKVAATVGSGCPSFGGQRTVASARTRKISERLLKHLSLSIEASSFEPAASHQTQGRGAFSERGSAQASVGQRTRPALVCFAIQVQGKAASPRAWPNPSFKRTCLRQAA